MNSLGRSSGNLNMAACEEGSSEPLILDLKLVEPAEGGRLGHSVRSYCTHCHKQVGVVGQGGIRELCQCPRTESGSRRVIQLILPSVKPEVQPASYRWSWTKLLCLAAVRQFFGHAFDHGEGWLRKVLDFDRVDDAKLTTIFNCICSVRIWASVAVLGLLVLTTVSAYYIGTTSAVGFGIYWGGRLVSLLLSFSTGPLASLAGTITHCQLEARKRCAQHIRLFRRSLQCFITTDTPQGSNHGLGVLAKLKRYFAVECPRIVTLGLFVLSALCLAQFSAIAIGSANLVLAAALFGTGVVAVFRLVVGPVLGRLGFAAMRPMFKALLIAVCVVLTSMSGVFLVPWLASQVLPTIGLLSGLEAWLASPWGLLLLPFIEFGLRFMLFLNTVSNRYIPFIKGTHDARLNSATAEIEQEKARVAAIKDKPEVGESSSVEARLKDFWGYGFEEINKAQYHFDWKYPGISVQGDRFRERLVDLYGEERLRFNHKRFRKIYEEMVLATLKVIEGRR